MRRARALLAVLVLAALVAAAARIAGDAGRGGRGTAAGSSLRADEAGLLGARLLLERLGRTVESRTGPHLPDGAGHVLLRVEGGPQDRERVAVEEQAAGAELAAWTARGNAVVLLAERTPVGTGWPAIDGGAPAATSPAAAPAPPPPPTPAAPPQADPDDTREVLDELFGVDRVEVPEPDEDQDVATEGALTGVPAPPLAGRARVIASGADEVLARRGDDVVAAVVVAGAGRVVVLADPWLATNVRLANDDRAAGLLAALVEIADPAGDATVWFDDRAAGQTASRGVLSLFGEIGLGPALAAGFLLLLLVAWRAAASDAPDRVVRPDLAYRPEHLAVQRGDLYSACLTTDEARRIVRDDVARRLGRGDRLGCDRAVALLAARAPDRAARIRAALDALPDHPLVTPHRHPDVWCAAVAAVQRALEDD